VSFAQYRHSGPRLREGVVEAGAGGSQRKCRLNFGEERKAQEIDPFTHRTNQLYTWTLYLAGQFDEAID
jgi:hypothetical protein